MWQECCEPEQERGKGCHQGGGQELAHVRLHRLGNEYDRNPLESF